MCHCAWCLVLVCGLFIVSWGFNLGVSKSGPYLSVFTELLEFACVESEGSGVPVVRLTIPWDSSVFSSDPQYLALCHLWLALEFAGVCGVGENKIVIKLVRLLWAASGASRSKPLADHYPGVNRELRRLIGHSNHENLEVL